METAPWGEELKEEKASISPPVRTWQTVPFVVGPTPPLPFPARCSPWQPFFQTRGAEPQQQQRLVSGELGSPGGWDRPSSLSLAGHGPWPGFVSWPLYHFLCPGTTSFTSLSFHLPPPWLS